MKYICENCKKEFESEKKTRFCCKKCSTESRIKKQRETLLEKYGVENISQLPSVKKKKEETCFKHYGVKNPSQSSNIMKIKSNNVFKKYGVFNTTQSDVVKEKIKETIINKYGVENISQLESVKNAKKQKSLDTYGVECVLQSTKVKDKIKETCLKKYGYEYALQSNEVKNKSKETIKAKYGCEWYTQSDDYKEKTKITNLKKYGTDHPMKNKEVLQKMHNTKHVRHSFTLSRPEDKIERILKERFKTVYTQYKSEEYPFNCDFYIPELNLYIEYQGYWMHGSYSINKIYGPYDPFNQEHVQIVERWKEKSIKNAAYKHAIKTWTITDPLKRKTAKENNLNWIEFFTVKEFICWFDLL